MPLIPPRLICASHFFHWHISEPPKVLSSCILFLKFVTYHDCEHDQTYEFITNIFDLSAKTIAEIYYLLLAWIKFQTRFKRSLNNLSILVRELLIHRSHLIDFLHATPKNISKFKARDNPQLALC